MKNFVFIISIFLTGCATSELAQVYPPLERDKHILMRHYSKIDNVGLVHLSCSDKIDGESAYKDFVHDDSDTGRLALASDYYAYAAMSNNVYRTPSSKPIFKIPLWYYLSRAESVSGLSVDDYGDSNSLAESSEIVVAFRGTDFTSFEDWGTNLAITEPTQYKEAYSHVKKIKENYPQAKLTVTGHSLGGAIALNMSMRFEGVNAVVFNSSPRAFFGETQDFANKRVHIYEVGEVLNLIAGPWLSSWLPEGTIYGKYNFLDYKFTSVSPIPEHSIYELTRGLLLIAMSNGNTNAKLMFVQNIDKEQAMRIDPEGCSNLYGDI